VYSKTQMFQESIAVMKEDIYHGNSYKGIKSHVDQFVKGSGPSSAMFDAVQDTVTDALSTASLSSVS
jgi:hypothetical protein